MATNDPNDPSLGTDAAFERWLLDSAKSDAPPEGATQRAWAQLTQAASVALSSDTVKPGLDGRSDAVGNATALKSLLIGALGGGLVTAAWMGGLTGLDAPASVPTRSTQLDSAPMTAPAVGPSPAEPEPSAPFGVADAASAVNTADAPPHGPPSASRRAPARSARRGSEPSLRARPGGSAALPTPAPVRAPAPEEPSSASSLESTLEREVALLDAIRSALAKADFVGCLMQVAQYRHEFEHGELARDADVFEIEALAGRGERARAARAAQSFLRRYPHDPHAARLRAFAELESR